MASLRIRVGGAVGKRGRKVRRERDARPDVKTKCPGGAAHNRARRWEKEQMLAGT
jgi:hypothetical protein